MPLFTKVGKLMVFDLINQANPSSVPYTETNSAIEKITAGNFTVDGILYNTSARLRGLAGAGYTGSKTVYYNRLSLASLFQNAQPRVDSFSAAQFYDALDAFNTRYGLKLTQADVTNPAFAGAGQPNYNNSTNISGLAGSAILTTAAVRLYYYRGLPKLEAFVITKNLNAYKHPTSDGNATKLAVQMLTIGLDFTEFKNLLTVDSTGMPAFADLSHVMTTQFGLPVWDAPLNSQYVTDNLTTAVGNANTAFDRVVVQTGIDNGVVTGVAYYHYMS